MNTLRSMALAALLTVVPATSVLAQESLPTLLESVESAERTSMVRAEQLTQALAEFDLLAARIEDLKTEGADSPLSLLALQPLMEQALSLSEQLEALASDARAAASRSTQIRQQALAAVEASLERLEQSQPWDTAAAARAGELLTLAEQLRPQPNALPPIDLDAIRQRVTWSPEELEASADELADYRDALRTRLEQVAAQREQAARQERLEQRARGLAMEESLFDDSFSRRFPTREQAAPTVQADDAAPRFGEDQVSNNGAPEFGGDPGGVESDLAGDETAGGAESLPGGGEPEMGAPVVEGAQEVDAAVPPSEVTVSEPVRWQNTDSISGRSGVSDPTLLRTDGAQNGTGRRRRSATDELNAAAAELQRQIELVEEQEAAFRRQANELQDTLD
jgi:hypothetical protein